MPISLAPTDADIHFPFPIPIPVCTTCPLCIVLPYSLICKHVYLDGFQYPLDPPLVTGRTKATAATSLAALARVNRLFYAEAQPYLYADVSIGLPSSFESFLGTVGVLQQHDSNPDMTDGRDVRGRQSFEERMGILTPPDSRETSRERGKLASRKLLFLD